MVIFAGMKPLYTVPFVGLIGGLVAIPVAWLVFRLLAAQMSALGGRLWHVDPGGGDA